jgi:hypothetical protein
VQPEPVILLLWTWPWTSCCRRATREARARSARRAWPSASASSSIRRASGSCSRRSGWSGSWPSGPSSGRRCAAWTGAFACGLLPLPWRRRRARPGRAAAYVPRRAPRFWAYTARVPLGFWLFVDTDGWQGPLRIDDTRYARGLLAARAKAARGAPPAARLHRPLRGGERGRVGPHGVAEPAPPVRGPRTTRSGGPGSFPTVRRWPGTARSRPVPPAFPWPSRAAPRRSSCPSRSWPRPTRSTTSSTSTRCPPRPSSSWARPWPSSAWPSPSRGSVRSPRPRRAAALGVALQPGELALRGLPVAAARAVPPLLGWAGLAARLPAGDRRMGRRPRGRARPASWPARSSSPPSVAAAWGDPSARELRVPLDRGRASRDRARRLGLGAAWPRPRPGCSSTS